MTLNPDLTNETPSSNKNKKYSRIFPETDGDQVVISGMSGKFPNSRNIAEYEYNLFNKIDMVDDDERRWRHFNPEIPKRAGKLFDLEKFDATFFGVHFKQAHTMDPQCRVLMEVAYEAVIDAGINPKDLRGSRTGVYIGSCISESEKTWFYEKVSSGGFGITGCSRAMLANRISYALGLNGPSYLVDTACSSSMYALDNAFTALRNGEIDAAIIGGANLLLHPFVTLQFARLGVLASHGFCRPFDQDASGYTRAEAINCMFLQRKRDAKRIFAEVIYSKTNCDGYKPEGITYPSGNTQEKLLREFYADVDVKPSDLGYLEAHSTGTIVGDPEECRAIDNVLCCQRNDSLLVGSVKSNVGHSEAASGICSLVKAVFAFEHGKIPPNINFNTIKTEIPALSEGRLTVVKDIELLPKPYIGVNSFGFGGANAHALLKACDKEKINNGLPLDDIPRIIGWAGRTEQAVSSILESVEKHPLDAEFIGLLHNVQRDDVSGLVFRGYGIFSKNATDNAKCLAKDIQHYTGIKRPLVWVFSGMGSQWIQMGASLMDIPIFRNSIELCHNALKSKDLDLIKILTSTDAHIFDNILHSFVGIAAIQIGLVDVLRALNLEPDYIIGHSVGELGCGYADGGFTPEQMILAAYYRGKVSLEIEKIRGSMAAIGIGYKQIVNLVPESIEVACHNGEDSSTISGPAEDVTRFVADLKSQGIFAKEVPSSNIAYHSRYIAHMGPQLLKYLKTAIPHPKQRSSKWLSSSVPKAEWEQTGRDLCSAEYHTNNLLSSVLFEETFALLPKNALTIEIAPHGLLQAILKRSMPGGVHIALTQRGSQNNAIHFLGALGKLFNNGVMLPFQNLYPSVQFPVSRGTPGIAALIKWDHNEDWFVTKYENMKTKASGERIFNVNLQSDDEEYMSGHVIDGKILVPATGYLQYVWETFSLMYHGPSYMDVPVEFEDVRFIRATPITVGGSVELKVMIHYGTGNFEITESNSVVVTGSIREISADSPPPMQIPLDGESKFPMMAQKDFYKELKLRGYHYNGSFKAVRAARSDGKYGQIEWKYNWVTFMDAMLQIHIIGTDSRTLLLPTKIRKLRINGRHHFDMMSEMNPDDCVLDVYASDQFDKVVAGGIEMIGLHASPIQRKRPPGIPVLERYQFIPHFPAPKLNLTDAARVCIQLGLENLPVPKIKIVEVDTEHEAASPVIGFFLDAVEDLPVVTGDYMFLTNQAIELPGVHVESGKLSTQSNCYFIIVKNLLSQGNLLELALKSLSDGGFLVARQTQGQVYDANLSIPSDLKLVLVIPTIDDEVILLLQKQKNKFLGDAVAIKVSVNDREFKWIVELQEAMQNGPVVVYAENEKFNGLLGLANCLRKEPDGHLVRCVLIDDVNAPEFNLESLFYKEQLALGLGINVYRNGQWGTYRHLQLSTETQILPRADHIYVNVIHRGDLSSLRWFEGPSAPKDCEIKIMYSSINFRDIMLATGRLAAELNGSSRMDLSLVLGLEYSGVNTRTGKRIMSMIIKGGAASYVDKPSRLIWNVPDNWSLQEAATVPVVYTTVYYAFFYHVDIRKGRSILIHAGTGGVGLAAIRVALAYGLEVYTTVSSKQKREFLLQTFPELEDSHIGYSRDTSFETMIQQQTKGQGVDFVLNSLSDEKLLASVRCLGQGGHFLEIGKFDMANDSKLGMGCFLKEITFHAVLADSLLTAPDSVKNSKIKIKLMIDDDIAGGIIQPLPSTVFPASDIEHAFRHLIGGKHIGKVLVQIRDDIESPYTLPVPVLKQVYFNPELCYVIPGGLGGFGLELADWIVMRGAKKLLLSSSRGISKDYQSYRIALWKTYGCEVLVSTADITTRAGCEKLLKEAIACAPIGGIFNLAVVLRDGLFANQSVEKFLQSFAPKAFATQYLDELSRKMCPYLEQFIVFSSVSCGRGNAGQTNYGMANSIMERIIEDRVANGLPGKAVQWGAVGEVGLVADMAEDKIDMEIGGTLQQRISSCLQELDNLIPTTDAIVASMVVAEKRVGRGGNESITETVMNIMGIRDLKSVSLGMTLSEMGMDSLMAVEIKQTLERDFEMVLSPQDLRSLTFQKLQEYEDAKEGEGNDVVKLVLASENTPLGMELLLRNLGDEANCTKVLCPLLTSADASKLNLNPSIIIPGLEGTSGEAWYTIGKGLYSKSVVLQLHQTANLTTIKEVSQTVFESVKSVLKSSEKFYIIGYSFGTFVALYLASLLEKAGYRGQVLLIDGAPHFLKALTLGHLGEDYKDEDLYNLLFSGIVNQIFPNESTESAGQIFLPLKTFEEKMTRFMQFVEKQNLYSKEYSRVMVSAMFNRVKMAAEFDLESLDVLKAPITLVRPSEVAMVDVEEDYSLSKFTKSTVTVKFVEGSHTTMLDNPKLAKIINDFDPALQEDKTFELYLKDVKPVAVL